MYIYIYHNLLKIPKIFIENFNEITEIPSFSLTFNL